MWIGVTLSKCQNPWLIGFFKEKKKSVSNTRGVFQLDHRNLSRYIQLVNISDLVFRLLILFFEYIFSSSHRIYSFFGSLMYGFGLSKIFCLPFMQNAAVLELSDITWKLWTILFVCVPERRLKGGVTLLQATFFQVPNWTTGSNLNFLDNWGNHEYLVQWEYFWIPEFTV